MNRILSTVGLCWLSLAVTAQNDSTSALPSDEKEVIKAFELTLEQRSKLATEIPDLTVEKAPRNYNYDMQLKPLQLEYPAPYIRPKAYKFDKAQPQKTGYIKAGYGLLQNPMFKAGVYQHAENYYDLGLDVDYESINESSVENKAQSHLGIGLSSKYFITKNTVATANVDYGHRNVHFFAFEQDSLSSFVLPDKRRIRNVNIALGIDQYLDRAKPNWLHGSLSYQNYHIDDLAITEHRIQADMSPRYAITESLHIGADLSADWSWFDNQESENNTIYTLVPYMDYSSDNWYLKLGAQYVIENDETNLLPDASLNWHAVDHLSINLSASSGVRKYSVGNNTAINPFIASFLPNNQNTRYTDYGINAEYDWSGITIEAKVSYVLWQDELFFINSAANPNVFAEFIDDMSQLTFGIRASRSLSDMHHIEASIMSHSYDNNLLSEAWGKATLDAQLRYTIKPIDKLAIETNMYWLSGITAIDLDDRESVVTLLPTFDLNIDAHYEIKDFWSVFLETRNLLGADNQRWQGYDMFGINVRAGVQLVF